MKKLFIVLVFVCSAAVGFAQPGKGVKSLADALRSGSEIPQAVGRQVAKQLSQMSGISMQIMNLPGTPLVRLRTAIPAEGNPVSARVLGGDQIIPLIAPEGSREHGLLVPPSLNTQKQIAYRAMVLNNTDELKNILENGLEAWRARDGEMFFSGWLRTALRFIAWNHEKMSTVIQFQVPKDISLYQYDYNYYTKQDIPPSHLTHVMVFLEINGKSGWYKVTLEDGELVFTLQHTQTVEKSGEIEHTFEVPLERIDWRGSL